MDGRYHKSWISTRGRVRTRTRHDERFLITSMPMSFDRAYKNHLSDFRTWNAKEHAENWLVYPENIGRQLCIDETSLSRGMWVVSPLSWLIHFFLSHSARFLLGFCSVSARYLNASKSRQFRDSTETLPTHSRARARNLSGRNVTTDCRLSIPKIIKKQILFAQFKEKQYLCPRNWVIGFVCSFCLSGYAGVPAC